MKKAGLLPGLKKAAIYLRVSTAEQGDEGVSLAAQERLNRAYAAENGWEIEERHVYREVKSGGELFERAQLMALLEAARRGEFAVVIADCLDRWVRDDSFDGWLDTELRRVGVRVVFASETYGSDFAGRLQRSLKSQFAQEERRKISGRCRKVYEERVEQQIPTAMGPAAYGYQWERGWRDTKHGPMLKATGVLLIDNEEAAVVRRVFDLILAHWSLRAIARHLNGQGVPTPSASTQKAYSRRAALWCVETLASMVRDPIYKGERRVRWQRSLAVDPEAQMSRAQAGLSGTAKMVRRPPEEWRSIPAPALVSEATWNAAQVMVSQRHGVFRTRSENQSARGLPAGVLRGVLYCARDGCGARLYPETRPGERIVYRCSSRQRPQGACGAAQVEGVEIEGWVKAQVGAFLQEPERIEKELARWNSQENQSDLAAELDRQYRAQMAVTRRQERLLALFAGAAEESLPVALIQRQLADAEREWQGLETVIAALKARERQQQASAAQVAELSHYVARVGKKLAKATDEEWRQVFAALALRVMAQGGEQAEWWVEVRLDPEAEGEGVLRIAAARSKQNTLTFTLARWSGK